jgi:P27 family predicted phage terminase small subunit
MKAQCPEWLQGSAREHWPQISEMLSNMKLNSSHYTVSMALLCDALADFIRFSELATGAEPITQTDKGNVVQHPIVGLKNKAWARVLAACREFGMSPAALRGISMPDHSPVDELDQVLA